MCVLRALAEVRGQFDRLGSLLHPLGLQESDSSPQAWQQVALLELRPWPTLNFMLIMKAG